MSVPVIPPAPQRPGVGRNFSSAQTLAAGQTNTHPQQSLDWSSYPANSPSFNAVFEDAGKCKTRLEQEPSSNGWMESYPSQSNVLVADITRQDINIMSGLKEAELYQLLSNTKHPKLRVIFLTATQSELDKKWYLNVTCKSLKDIVCKYGLPSQAIPYLRNPVRQNFGARFTYQHSSPTSPETLSLDFWYRLGAPVIVKPGTDKLDWIFTNGITHIDDSTGTSVMIFKLMYSKKLGVQAGELFNRGMDVIRHAHGTESDPFAFHLWVIEWMQGVWRESIDGMWWDSGIQNMTKAGPEELRSLDLGVLHRQRELLESYSNWLGVQKDVISGLKEQHIDFLSMFKNIPPKVTSHRVGVALNMIKGHCDYLIRSAAGSDRRAQNFINLKFEGWRKASVRI